MLVHKIIFVRLEHLTLKGLTFKSPDVFSLIIQQVPNVTVLTFYHNIEDIQQNRVPAREPINEEKLEKLLQKKCLQHLRELTITGINMEFGPIFLTHQRKGPRFYFCVIRSSGERFIRINHQKCGGKYKL